MELIIVILEIIIIALLLFSIKRKRAFSVLIKEGKIEKDALKKSKLTIEDLQEAAREKGYFNLADIEYALLEKSGNISFLPTAQKRALNPKDFNFAPVSEGLTHTVIKDGQIIKSGLKDASFSEKSLNDFLLSRGYDKSEILLATINDAGRVDVFV